MTLGFKLKGSFATNGNVTVQPKSSFPTLRPIGKQKVLPENTFTALSETVKSKFVFSKFDFRLIANALSLNNDTRYNDELPRSSTKFTAFEELSGIASTRPDILCVSEFKPIFTNNGYGLTAAGDFLDAQVKLMNLRHEALVTLINDLKTEPNIAEQLDKIEGDFLEHVKKLKERVDFLASLQTYIEKIVNMLDLRDAKSIVDCASVLSHYYTAAFSNLNTAQATLPSCTYVDLLSQHGFNKNNVNTFSSTKVFLQTLYEAKKTLRAGSDELIGVDPSLTNRDVDPVTLNKRSYPDPHLALERVGVLSFDYVKSQKIHESDTRLNSFLQILETDIRSIDKVFAGLSSEEIAYTLKLKTLAREASYSYALSKTETMDLLIQYGYPVRADIGNQQLFDAVYGQLGSRITDNRAGTNANAVASIVSRVDGAKAVLTYEVDYLEDEQGSVFTPGAAYYVTSAIRPSPSSAFSHERAAELVTRMTSVVDNYMNFIGRFNILPRVGNVVFNQLANASFVLDPVVMANSLYQLFVDNSSGRLKNDVAANPVVGFLSEAATHAGLRANLVMYVSAVTNVSGEGLADAQQVQATRGVDLRAEAMSRQADADEQIARVSPTVDKLIKNCVTIYKQITGDNANATKVEYALKNFNEQGPLARMIAYVQASFNVYKSIMNAGYTRYSHLSDLHMVTLSLQVVLDTARRYAYHRKHTNYAAHINSNFKLLDVFGRTTVQQATPQAAIKASGKRKTGILPVDSISNSGVHEVLLTISKLPLKQSIVARLEREELLMLRTTMAPLRAMYTVQDNMREFVLYMQKSDNVKVINDVLNIVGDRKLVELLADKGQVRLLFDTVDTVIQKIGIASDNATSTDLTDVVSLGRTGSPDDDLKVFDDSFVTSKTANIIKAAFATAKFSPERGSNIRVIAVGLPHGFSTYLKNKFKITTFAEQTNLKRKQNDVVIVDVYKIDVRYPDLIFKPIPKVLEMSRFAVRDEKQFASVEVGTPLEKVLDAIPTKDYSNFSNTIVTRADQASLGSEYDFMTAKDATAMLRNTSLSYLLEVYFRLLTGIPLSEREFYVADPDENDRPAPFVVQSILDQATRRIFKVDPQPSKQLPFDLFASARQETLVVERSKPRSKLFGKIKFLPNLDTKAHHQVAAIAPIVSQAGSKKTVYVDKEVAAKYMMSPKIFERVFFIDVDPDDFEIDLEETFKSEVGRAAFRQLQQAGEIESISETLGQSTRDVYYLKDHTLEKQMTFEKYFTVVRDYTPITTRTS